MKNTCFIYKNDLKFDLNLDNNDVNNDVNNDFNNIKNSEFDTEEIKTIYNNFKNKPKIELRIEDSKLENYKYLDLSKLEINDLYMFQLLGLEKIKNILKKIEFLDLSNNKLSFIPNLSDYPNILYLNVSFNEITNDITNNNLLELTCHNNNITSINSNSLIRLSASNNNITLINTPNIEMLIINSNRLEWIESYLSL